MYNGRALDRPVYRFLRLLFLLGLVHGFYLLAQEGLRAWELARERAALKEEVARARAEVERLKEEVRAARDPAYLEALLRRMVWVPKDEEVMMRDPRELFWEDEGLTEGLTDEEAQFLLGWLMDVAEDLDPAHLAHLRRLGREITRLARDYGVPVGELVQLVELAWSDPEPEGLQA